MSGINNSDKIVVKTLAESLLNGRLKVKNSDQLQGYNVEQLYKLLIDKMEFVSGNHTIKIEHIDTIDVNKIRLYLPTPALYVNSIYIEDIGDISEMSETIDIKVASDVIDINKRVSNVSVDVLDEATIAKVNYIGFNKELHDIVDNAITLFEEGK